MLKNNHGVLAFVFAQLNNNVSAASSMMNLPPTQATNFLQRINQNEHLVIKNRAQVERIYNEDGLMGLFSLFFTLELMKDIIRWTNEGIHCTEETPISQEEFCAYLGLEMAMSIVVLASIKEYWSSNLLLGQGFFKAVMSWKRFQFIQA